MTPARRERWDRLMRAGLGALRLSPAEFWSMTPRELDAALRGRLGPAPGADAPGRGELDALLARFPDGGPR